MVSMSDISSPALASALAVAGSGPLPMRVQFTPATARATMSARGVRPSRSANARLVTSSADAPIEIGLLVAAGAATNGEASPEAVGQVQ